MQNLKWLFILLADLKYSLLLFLLNHLTRTILYSTILYRGSDVMIKTNGGFLISQIKAVQGRVFEKLLTESEVDEFNGAQGRILYVLWQEDNLPIVELSKRTGLAKTTLTSMLDRLEGKGFLSRCADKENRRQIRILLTKKAKALEDKYNEVSNEMSEIFYRDFSDNEIRDFENKLNRILENLKEK